MSKLNVVIIHELGSNEVVAEINNVYFKQFRAVAKCSPEDKFDLDFGIKLATKRVKAKALAYIAKRDFDRVDNIQAQIKRLKQLQRELYINAENCADNAMEIRAELRDENHHI